MASPSASSGASFHTPRTTPTAENGKRGSGAGSGSSGNDVASAAAVGAETTSSKKRYRPVRQLPYELKGHVRVFLEERMYNEAMQLLTSLLAAGGSERRTEQPVWIPPPSHLAVLATLMVHPAYTSRTQENTDLRVAGHALQYLRHILAVAGPVQPDFRTAFAFRDVRGRGGGSGAVSLGSGGASTSASVNVSASASRSHSRPRRLRMLGARSGIVGGNGAGGGGGGNSDYVDSRTLKFDDDDNERARAVLAAAGISVDVLSPSAGGDGGGADVDLGSALEFSHVGGGVEADMDMDADEDAVSGRMATRDSVWTRGQDFWRVAGWVFSCSVEAPLRWRYWQAWLALVVDVLEADLAARLGEEHAQGDSDKTEGALLQRREAAAAEIPLQKSLLFSYLQGWGGHTQLRHLASAIVTDGSQAAHLREVFDKETTTTTTGHGGAAGTNEMAAASTRLFDLDTTKFGDYSDDESPQPSPTRAMGERKTTAAGADSGYGSGSYNDRSSVVTIPNPGNGPGFLESVPLRRRLFYLVVLAAMCFPDDFAPVDVVYRTFADVLRETDVTVFSSFVSLPPPAASAVLWTASAPPPITANDAFVGLFRHILFTVLPLSAPKPRLVDPDADSRLGVSQQMLERCFLPFAANTVVLGANVRMALVLESLFRIVWGAGRGSGDNRQFCWTTALQEAAEAGVRVREARPRPPRKKTFELEAFGQDLMRRSGRRLLNMVQLAKMEVGGDEGSMTTSMRSE